MPFLSLHFPFLQNAVSILAIRRESVSSWIVDIEIYRHDVRLVWIWLQLVFEVQQIVNAILTVERVAQFGLDDQALLFRHRINCRQLHREMVIAQISTSPVE